MIKLWYLLIGLLFPPKCILCGKLLEKGALDLCQACRIKAPFYTAKKTKLQFLDSFTAVWYYEGDVRHSLLRYKFYHARHLASGYGRLLAMALANKEEIDYDLITWIPVSPLRKLRRGYDQVELLARAVGSELGLRPEPLLKKVRHNPPQSGMSDTASRRANVAGVYRVIRPELIAGKRILLLDDILTTGSTAGEAARVLRTAGAKEVHCAAIAAARK